MNDGVREKNECQDINDMQFTKRVEKGNRDVGSRYITDQEMQQLRELTIELSLISKRYLCLDMKETYLAFKLADR